MVEFVDLHVKSDFVSASTPETRVLTAVPSSRSIRVEMFYGRISEAVARTQQYVFGG